MATNLECAILLQKLGLLSSEKNKFLDIGPQNIYFCTEDQIATFLANQDLGPADETIVAEMDHLVYFRGEKR